MVIIVTVLAVVGARQIPELSAFTGMAGVAILCVIVGAPNRQIARARKVSAILSQEQEPYWLTGGSIALSNLGITPPSGTQWWWTDRVAFVFCSLPCSAICG